MPTERVKEWREMYDPDVSHLINEHCDPLPKEVLRHSDLKNVNLLSKLGLIDLHSLPAQGSEEREAAI